MPMPVQQLCQGAPGVAVGRHALQRQNDGERGHALDQHQRDRPAQHLPLEHRRLRTEATISYVSIFSRHHSSAAQLIPFMLGTSCATATGMLNTTPQQQTRSRDRPTL